MKKNKKRITEKMTLYEAININEKAAEIFMKYGMLCGCCSMSSLETIEEGAKLHNINLKKLLKELNE
ncbi:MAG: DUF1858 domain-containing protein [Candidatus Pacearchaeota archaeon]